MGPYSGELQKIIGSVSEIRRQGQEVALQALINFSVAYDDSQITFEQCKLLADFRLVEYDHGEKGFVVSQEVVEWARYFVDTRESGRYGAVRGLLRKYYLIQPERVRRLEALLMHLDDKPVLEVHHLQEMDLIWKCGDTHVLRSDVATLFREYFKNKPAGRVTLHERPESG